MFVIENECKKWIYPEQRFKSCFMQIDRKGKHRSEKSTRTLLSLLYKSIILNKLLFEQSEP